MRCAGSEHTEGKAGWSSLYFATKRKGICRHKKGQWEERSENYSQKIASGRAQGGRTRK